MAFLEGTCSVLCFGLEGVSSVLEGHGIFGGRLQCFGGVCLAVFWRGVTFWRRRLQSFGGCGIFGGHMQCCGGAWHFGGVLALYRCFEWRGILEGACSVLEECS